MEWEKFEWKKIALRILYVGLRYSGFASEVPEHCNPTVEGELIKALIRTKLVRSRESCEYSRSARTDKGVSASGQVVSLKVRWKRKSSSAKERPDIVQKLNRVLPEDIRITGMCEIEDTTFDARFSCRGRAYKYFFMKKDLNVDRMREAAMYFIGEHDFRNFCKRDPRSTGKNFTRIIYSCDIRPVANSTAAFDFPLYEFDVDASAFLHNQVRCMMAMLFLIGEGRNNPEIIVRMLDVHSASENPKYSPVAPDSLLLCNCEYDNVTWEISERAKCALRDGSRELFEKLFIRNVAALELLKQEFL